MNDQPIASPADIPTRAHLAACECVAYARTRAAVAVTLGPAEIEHAMRAMADLPWNPAHCEQADAEDSKAANMDKTPPAENKRRFAGFLQELQPGRAFTTRQLMREAGLRHGSAVVMLNRAIDDGVLLREHPGCKSTRGNGSRPALYRLAPEQEDE